MPLSQKLANYLVKHKGIEDRDQQEILAFGAEVLLGLFSGIFITLCLGYLLDLHILIFYMLLASFMIRKTAGGAHSAHPFNCLLITVASYNLLAYIARDTVIYVQHFLSYFLIGTFIIGIIVVYMKAPVESPQKPLNLEQRKVLRKLALLSVLLISGSQFITFFYFNKSLVNYAVSIGLLWQYLMLTSTGHRMIFFLDKLISIISRKGGETIEKD
ncbi:Accessory gene regulator B [Desulfotomaculum nigrificans CO-1-SRB]|uniref:Accessory gene regulator B n=1 Tax=Desulfotomaculum nigrificans (strain DSM 14880 / VKM B-2319 / CO-1-SRB) TaxID=868595 RepID=F6B2T9_DESCC|nr:accessory gene regulator B family protein [Desulfotomaculum nigrificans]AEF95047.1 Accessory gene regulator B [Desulfotomaculum nigrificans CO-1-SRB]